MLLAATAAAPIGGWALASFSLQGPPRPLVQFGYVRSLAASGTAYELRFDPALWLSGRTATRAAIDDGVIEPGDIVPNDYYIRNTDRKRLAYRVPRGATVTVVTLGPKSTRIPVAELAAIVKGRNPKGRKLMDPGGYLGFWATVQVDTVTALHQQYQP